MSQEDIHTGDILDKGFEMIILLGFGTVVLAVLYAFWTWVLEPHISIVTNLVIGIVGFIVGFFVLMYVLGYLALVVPRKIKAWSNRDS